MKKHGPSGRDMMVIRPGDPLPPTQAPFTSTTDPPHRVYSRIASYLSSVQLLELPYGSVCVFIYGIVPGNFEFLTRFLGQRAGDLGQTEE